MLNNTFEAGMCMKTKDHKTQCPNTNRLIVLSFRDLCRTDTRSCRKLLLLNDSLSEQTGFSRISSCIHTLHRRRMIRPNFGCILSCRSADPPPRHTEKPQRAQACPVGARGLFASGGEEPQEPYKSEPRYFAQRRQAAADRG